MTNAAITLSIHDTPATIYDALARVFNKNESEGHTWITLNVEGVLLTFFEPKSNLPEPKSNLLLDAITANDKAVA